MRKGDVPSSAARQTGTLIARLRCLLAYPRLDVRRVVHVLVVSQDLDVFDDDIDNRRVFLVLAQTSDGDAVSAVDRHLRGVKSAAVQKVPFE